MPKKIIRFVSTLFLLLTLFIPLNVILAEESTAERWKSDNGAEYEAQRSGNQITFTRTKIRSGAPQRLIGTVALKGTITGTTFNGTVYNFKVECPPSFDVTTPASGTVSEDGNSITIKFDAMLYNPETCRDSGKKNPASATFTKIISASLPPTSKNSQIVGHTGTTSAEVDDLELSDRLNSSPLILAGLILLAVIGSVVYFLKKRVKNSKFSKKKR